MNAVKTSTERDALEARAQEIKYLGTQFAMNGLTPPRELEEEFAKIQAALRAASYSTTRK